MTALTTRRFGFGGGYKGETVRTKPALAQIKFFGMEAVIHFFDAGNFPNVRNAIFFCHPILPFFPGSKSHLMPSLHCLKNLEGAPYFVLIMPDHGTIQVNCVDLRCHY